MLSSNSEDEIHRSRKNRDKARNEQQKNVLLIELFKALGERGGELGRRSGELQSKSCALMQKSKKLRGG